MIGGSLAVGAVFKGASAAYGAFNGGIAGYRTDGWKGALAGASVGAIAGAYGNWFGGAVRESYGLLPSVGANVGVNFAGGAFATVVTNELTGTRNGLNVVVGGVVAGAGVGLGEAWTAGMELGPIPEAIMAAQTGINTYVGASVQAAVSHRDRSSV